MTPAAKKPLVLIGLMATGKSTIGRQFAVRQGWKFIDTDSVIVDRHGPIADIFAVQGEAAFRKLEADVVSEVLSAADPSTVVSLGGGSVLSAGTRELLGSCLVAFLDADLATVLPRITGNTGRPLLSGDAETRWARLEQERRPLYEALADVVVDTRGASIESVVGELESQLRRLHVLEEGSSGNDR